MKNDNYKDKTMNQQSTFNDMEKICLHKILSGLSCHSIAKELNLNFRSVEYLIVNACAKLKKNLTDK